MRRAQFNLGWGHDCIFLEVNINAWAQKMQSDKSWEEGTPHYAVPGSKFTTRGLRLGSV